MVVTPKREKVAVLLCAGHKTNDIIALAGVSHNLVDTIKKLLKTSAPLEKRSRKPRTCTARTPRLLSHLKKSIKATSSKSMRVHAKDLGISFNSFQCEVPFWIQLPGISLKNSDPVDERSCREVQQGLYITTGWHTSPHSTIDQACLMEAGIDFWQKNM